MATDGARSVIMPSGGVSAVESKVETHHLDQNVELERLKQECSEMIYTLKALHDEEKRLREGNHILAQQAVIMGCTAGFDAGARRGAGRKRPASASSNNSAAKKAAVSKPSNNTTSTPPPGPVVNAQGAGASPSKAPISVKVGAAASNQPNLRAKCEHILQVIYRHGIFTNLTHPARIAEGFVDLTIHMRVIQKKIESNAFASSFDLFKADVRQMFDSCLQGGTEGGLFHDVIKDLKKSYEFALANID
eukprot:scaffold657_cov72-Skeletonema_dohrnii-CCMP3373.AAC.1